MLAHRFIDFILDAMGELINQAAKMQYMSSGRLKMPLLLRGEEGYEEPRVGRIFNARRPDRYPAAVLEVADARATYDSLAADGVPFLAEPYAPPWGGLRFFVVDPDGYLVEIEQP